MCFLRGGPENFIVGYRRGVHMTAFWIPIFIAVLVFACGLGGLYLQGLLPEPQSEHSRDMISAVLGLITLLLALVLGTIVGSAYGRFIPKLRKRDSGVFPNQFCSDSHGERRRFAMPIPLRTDFDASALRSYAKKTKDGPQARRLLALAAIYDGATRTEAAKIGDVTLQIVRDWVVKFNAHGPDGLIDRKSPGQPSRLNDTHRAAIAAMVESGPIPAIHGVVRWRVIDLCQWVFEEFRVIVAKQTLSRELRAMGYRKLSARPRHHAQAEGAVEEYKKTSQRSWTRSRARRTSIRPQ
jgi:transposase